MGSGMSRVGAQTHEKEMPLSYDGEERVCLCVESGAERKRDSDGEGGRKGRWREQRYEGANALRSAGGASERSQRGTEG